jgi:hypothetical protein
LLLRGAEDMGGTEEWLKGIKTITSVQMAYDFPAEKHSKLTWITALSRL